MIAADNSNTQVEVLVTYLTGLPVSNTNIHDIYTATLGDDIIPTEKLTRLAFRHTWLIPFFDGALVFLRPHADLRRRIYIMFAILESTPEYSREFLPTKTSFGDFLGLVGTGFRAVFRAAVGIVIIKAGRL